MSFNLSKFLGVLGKVGPIILAATPGAEKIPTDLIPNIVDAIGEAQQIKGAAGPEKKAHVLNALGKAVAVANATGKVNLDADELKAVASTGIDNVIDTIHVIHGSKVTVDAPAAPPAAAAPAGDSGD